MHSNAQDQTSPSTRDGDVSGALGTFGGVFTPSILTILGIILFLRHGWVVGSGGLWTAHALVGASDLDPRAFAAIAALGLFAIAFVGAEPSW